MKNYVIINGVNSLTITGLAISKLPSISKPPLRVMTEEINGRDGDLITELGYGAYDKELVIGLYGNYDINEVIGFFNQEGTIVFSNEDDKYYNFKIINQIDYEALIKFRTATINLHCQPFKYPLTETPEEITTEYVEDEGEALTLNDTKIAPLEINLKGNTSQSGTPTPSSPIPVNVVSGDNEIDIVGKDLFDIQKLVKGRLDNGVIGYASGTTDLTLNENSFSFTTSANYRGVVDEEYITLEPSTDYVFKSNVSSGLDVRMSYYDSNKTFISSPNPTLINGYYKFTSPANAKYGRLGIQLNSSGTITIENPQLEQGSTPTTYKPYQSQNYPLYLGVENLFGVQDNTITTQGITITTANNNVSFVGTATRSYVNTTTIPINLPMGTYTISATNTNYNFYVWFKDNNNAEVGATSLYKQPRTITLTGNATKIQYGVESLTTGNSYNIQTNFQIETGSKANSYTPYGTTPIQLCNIGNYVDFPFKAINGDKYYDTLTQAQKDLLTYGKWYLHKEVGKYVYNNDLANNFNDSNAVQMLTPTLNITSSLPNLAGKAYCNIMGATLSNYTGLAGTASLGRIRVQMAKTLVSTYDEFKAICSNNNLTIYYVLNTPTEEEITNTTLINQLEALMGAMSYEGQTNISQVNNDLPLILSVKGIKEGSGEGIINNIGNIYAKPIIELEGTGTIGIYKNGTQYFEVDMSSDNEITIDTENMEAYHDGVLKNRKVIGDYNKFTIDEGNNNIEITGELTKATISNYTRWL